MKLERYELSATSCIGKNIENSAFIKKLKTYMKNWISRMTYNFTLFKGKKTTSCGKVTITFSCHIIIFSNLWYCIKEISDYYKPKIHTQKS